jgi:hypothetical protein
VHPLLYQRVPAKVPSEWDRQEVGNLHLDYVLHCGRSTAGEYVLTFSATDIATGWWEGRAQIGRSQKATQESLEATRKRVPFRVPEVHPDNDSGILSAGDAVTSLKMRVASRYTLCRTSTHSRSSVNRSSPGTCRLIIVSEG